MLKLDGPVTYTAGSDAEVPVIVDPAWVSAQGNKHLEAVESCMQQVCAMIAAAGIEAQIRYVQGAAQKLSERQLFFGAHGDVEEVGDILRPGQFDAYRDQVRAFLTKQGMWERVIAVAHLLMKTWPNAVSEADIEQTVRAHVSTNHRVSTI